MFTNGGAPVGVPPLGRWPTACPFSESQALALGWDGRLASVVTRAYLAHGGRATRLFVPRQHASLLLPDAWSEVVWLEAAADWHHPAAWGALLQAVQAEGLRAIVLPAFRDASVSGDLWHAAAEAMQRYDCELWVPMLHLGPQDLARLGDWLGVDWRSTPACEQGQACGECAGCQERRKLRAALGSG
ncbi:MAG: 7-cyano-7-deazaguanine synthase [Candidatus Sericytochromatia bacterium]|nr:7-cyano-7-deazaguanine synthase [Candidatus Sericytochromatia bacterium]